MPEPTQTAPFIDGLYGKLVEGGIGYFFPSAKFDLLEPDRDPGEHRITRTPDGTSLVLNWLGSRYSLTRDEPFSDAELKLPLWSQQEQYCSLPASVRPIF